tara:strand:+ start:244 stop:390 length:147 start_codon:yes stop_codon:yes gene_type:complete
MFRIYLIFLLLFSCSEEQFPWKKINFSEAKTMAMHSNKMIMIDFYADW